MTPLHMSLFLLLFQQLRNHFCTDLPHPQILRNVCPHPLAVHVQLNYNHSKNQSAISMHFLADKLDVFHGRACGRPLARGVIFYILQSLLNLLCHSTVPALNIVSSPYKSCINLSASVGFFHVEKEIRSWFVVRWSLCNSKNCGPKFFTTINARITANKSLRKSVQLTQNQISHLMPIM